MGLGINFKKMNVLFLCIVLFGCTTDSTNHDTENRCNDRCSIYFYSALNDDYKEILKNWSLQLSESKDREFSSEVIEIGTEINKLYNDIIISKLGGVTPSGNGYVENKVLKANFQQVIDVDFKNKLSNKLQILKDKYQSEKYRDIISFIEYSIEDNFLDDQSFLLSEVDDMCLSEMSVRLMLIEQSIYYSIHKSF